MSKIEDMVKGLFVGNGIVDELLTDKGLQVLIDLIPEDFIAWLASIKMSEFYINATAVLICKMLPKEYVEKTQGILRTTVSLLTDRVSDYRKTHGISNPDAKKDNDKSSDKPTPESSTPTPKTPSQIMAEYRALIMNPHPTFVPHRKERNDNLAEIYNRPNVRGDRYFGVDAKIFHAKVDEALSLLDKKTFIDLLYNGAAEDEARVSYIDAYIGELKPKAPDKTAAEIAADPNHPLNGVETLLQRLEGFSLSFGRRP